MSAYDYYLKNYGLDIDKLPRHVGNSIGGFYLGGSIFTKEELEKKFEDNNIEMN